MGRWANKYVIGLTGNIAMGKSLVRKMLENLGAYTIDADGLAHQAMAPGAPAYAPVIDMFGKWIVDNDKKIDRSKLGSVAFSHNDALNQLEKITHPVVGQAIDILISRAKQPIVVVEAIKLVDGILGNQVDTIWVVDATPEVQLQRMITRRNMSDWEAHKRIDTQNPQKDKLAHANVVITNNGSPEDVWTQVQREWDKITGKAQPSAAPVKTPPVTVNTTTANTAPASTVSGNTVTANVAAPPVQRPGAPPTAQPSTQTAPTQTASQPVSQTASQAGAQTTPPVKAPPPQLGIRRGLPRNAEAIAKLLGQASGKVVTRNDIMMAFGEKSYLLAEFGERFIGLAGFQVENLITRMDQFVVLPDSPLAPIARALITAVEDASRELQSEVSFVFVARNASPAVLQAFVEQGYERIEIDALKVPAWREAAAESQVADTFIMMKKLRAERVLTPV